MKELHLDFETASQADLKVVGLDNYANHPTTRVLMLAYAFDDDPVEVWEPHIGPMPDNLYTSLINPAIIKSAFNSTFERTIFRAKLGTVIPSQQWLDTMIWCRNLSMSGKLGAVGKAIGLEAELQKIETGGWAKKPKKGTKQLLRMFSIPTQTVKQRRNPKVKGVKHVALPPAERLGCLYCDFRCATADEGKSHTHIFDHTTHPTEWQELVEYCKRDVESERSILNKIRKFALPEAEHRLWCLDQEINDRGFLVNIQMVWNAVQMANQVEEELKARLVTLTGLDNPNSVQQMMGFLQDRGYEFESLGKDFVTKALQNPTLGSLAIEALRLRQELAKTSHKKYEAILNIVSEDGRLRHQFSFMGAARSGRWSGRDVQLQNLPRPIKEVEKNLDLAIRLIEMGDLEGIKLHFKASPLAVLSSCLRNVFIASPGCGLAVSDLNAIENRVLGWVARCEAILEVFHKGRDPYLAFGSFMYGLDYETLKAAYDAGDAKAKEQRQLAKPAVLGAGYRLGGGMVAQDKDGNDMKTGLWGYAESMGILMTQEQSHEAVRIFRDAYPEVCQLWYDLEKAAKQVIRNRRAKVKVGPVEFGANSMMMWITLPSGRRIHYMNPRIEAQPRPWSKTIKKFVYDEDGQIIEQWDETETMPTIMYDGIAHLGKGQQQVVKWGPVTTHGGKLTENIVQAISRDLLAYGMELAANKGLTVVAHVHDELVCEVRNESNLSKADLIQCMTVIPEWAEGLPLGADGYESKYYRKG